LLREFEEKSKFSLHKEFVASADVAGRPAPLPPATGFLGEF